MSIHNIRSHITALGASVALSSSCFSPDSVSMLMETASSGTGDTGGASSAPTGGASTVDTGVALPGVPVLQLSFAQIKRFDFSWGAVAGAEYYHLLERLPAEVDYGPIGDDIVGESSSLTMPLHLRFGASYILQACNGGGCTDSEPVDVVDSLATAVGYFKASNTDVDDLFGTSLALSADGNTLAVGADREGSAATGIGGDQASNSAGGAGAVYVFVRANGVWAQQAYVKASNTDVSVSDYFGTSLALSADGNTLAVGAYEDSAATGIGGDQANNFADDAGAVYVYVRANNAWDQQAYVKASNTDPNDLFGARSLALSADGNTLAVGAPNEGSAATGIGGDQADNSAVYAGAVYVFVRANGAWAQQAYVKASNTGGGWFGESLALSADGNTLAVGAIREDSAATGIGGDQADNSAVFAGAVCVFVRANNTWAQQAYVKASNTDANDKFGWSLALSADGNTLAVGAYDEDSAATGIGGDQADNSASEAGAVYVFVRANEVWAQQAYVKPSNPSDRFGWILALSADGNTLAVGAYVEDSAATGIGGDQASNSAGGAGAVYVFVRVNKAWAQEAYVKASNTDEGDQFGSSLALSADGNTLAVGAPGEDSAATGIGGDQGDNSATHSGAVYIY
jgi:hypothetical protein